MSIEESARELLAHDGIYAVAVSSSEDHTFSIAKEMKDPEGMTIDVRDRMTSICGSTIAMHRHIGIHQGSRLVVNEPPYGAITVVTTTIDDIMVALVVQTGHAVCKSLSRMVKRAVRRAHRKNGHSVSADASVP